MTATPVPRRPTTLAALTVDAKTRTTVDRVAGGRGKPVHPTFNSAV